MSFLERTLASHERANSQAIQTNVKQNKTWDTLPKMQAKDTMMPPAFSHVDNHRQTIYQRTAAEIISNTE